MPHSSSTTRILVFGPSWVGDMVLAHSLFQTLKAQQPNAQIDVAAPAWTLPLVERMPEIHQGIPLPFKHGVLALSERIQIGRALRSAQYDQAIVLVNSFKSAIVPFFAKIPQRTGFLGEYRYGLLNDIRPLDTATLPKTVQRFVALGLDRHHTLSNLPTPQPKLTVQATHVASLLERFRVHTERPILGLCPGAEYGEAKRWPARYYAEVANAALAQGWQVWLFGSEKDAAITAEINSATQSQCLDLGGKTTLGEAIDMMSLCHTVVTNDSGLMHVAAALNKKVIAVFGSSDPHHTPPMHPEAVILSLHLPCSPCFKRECPLGHTNCLNQLEPHTVLSKLKK